MNRKQFQFGIIRHLCGLLVILLIASVHAFDITPSAVTGGGGESSNANFSVYGSVEGIGGVMMGANTVENGFIPQILGDRTAYEEFLEDNFDAADRNNPGLESTIWGTGANLDNDGRVNLLEFALGNDPNDGGDPDIGITSKIVTDGNNDKFLEVTYTRRTNDPNLVFTAEVSGDNSNWNSGAGFVEETNVTTLDPNFEEVTVEDQIAILDGAPRLFRLKIEKVDLSTEAISAKHAGTVKTIAGNGGSGSDLTAFAPQVVQPLAYGGTVDGVGVATLVQTGATWSDDEFNSPNGSYYVEFDSGLMVDIVDTDAGGNELALENDVTGLVNAGDRFGVRSHLEIDDVLGANNEAGFDGGLNLGDSDDVFVFTPETQSTQTLFYSEAVGFEGWTNALFDPAGDTVIPPAQGLIIRRKVAGDVDVCLAGLMHQGPEQVAIYEGFNLVSTLKLLTDLQLDQLDLGSVVASGSNPSQSDNLILYNNDDSVSRYFLSDVPGFTGWHDATFSLSDSDLVEPGESFWIQRRAGNGIGNWTIPME